MGKYIIHNFPVRKRIFMNYTMELIVKNVLVIYHLTNEILDIIQLLDS